MLDLAQAGIDERWRLYEQFAGLERMVPRASDVVVVNDDEETDAPVEVARND
jgi:hypothetical protein